MSDKDLKSILLPGKDADWAQKLLEAQSAKDDLVRLLGLINQIGHIASRETALGVGANKMVKHIASYLNLPYLAFFVWEGGVLRLAASRGEAPALDVGRMVSELSAQRRVIYHQLDEDSCLVSVPLSFGKRPLGALVALRPALWQEKQKRHFRIVTDSLLPALEALILRQRLEEANRVLRDENQIALQSAEASNNTLQQAEVVFLHIFNQHSKPMILLDNQGVILHCNHTLRGLDISLEPKQAMLEALSEVEDRAWLEQSLVENRRSSRIVNLGVGYSLEQVEMRLWPLGSHRGQYLAELSPMHGPEDSPKDDENLRRQALSLASVSGEMIDNINDLLTALKSNLQLMQMENMPENIRRRAELMEELVDSGAELVQTAQGKAASLMEQWSPDHRH